MVGSRSKLVLLTSFFTFAFAISFFALIQNYAHAGNASLLSVHILAVASGDEIQSSLNHEIVPDY